MGEAMIFHLVMPGEAARLVAAHDRAVVLARRVRTLLTAAGFDAGSVQVVPSWTEQGGPVVYVSGLTGPARQGLAEILQGVRPPPDDRGGGQRAA